jgi:hypothetical protein
MPKAQSRQVRPPPSRRHLRNPGRDSQRRRLRIASAIADYLADVRARRSAQAADRLKQLLSDFRGSCDKRHLHTINRRNLIVYVTSAGVTRIWHQPNTGDRIQNQRSHRPNENKPVVGNLLKEAAYGAAVGLCPSIEPAGRHVADRIGESNGFRFPAVRHKSGEESAKSGHRIRK